MISISVFCRESKTSTSTNSWEKKVGPFCHIELESMLRSTLHHQDQHQCAQLFPLNHQCPCATLTVLRENCCRNTGVQRRASFIFSCVFWGMDFQRKWNLHLLVLEILLNQTSSGDANMWTGCSCSKVSWGVSNLGGNTGFHRCSTWLSLKDSKYFCPLFMLGNPTVCRVFRCGSQVYE